MLREQPPNHHIHRWRKRGRERGIKREREKRERERGWGDLPSNSSKYEDGKIIEHTEQDD